jgi:superfamily II DNA or RNA helicase
MTLQPRPYQATDLDKVATRFEAGVRNQLLKYATGLGKTPFFALLKRRLNLPGRKIVLAHTDELVQQAASKLRQWNPDLTVGIEKAEYHSNGEDIVVASVQTIGRLNSPRLLQFNPADFDALVVDEAHHATAPSYRTIINHFRQNPKLLHLGVTATPNRADGKGLGEIYDEIVADRDIVFGIREGWLADLRGIRIKTRTDISQVRSQAGDFQVGELSRTLNTPARNRLIVESWKEHAHERPTVIFTVDIQHAKDLAAEFERQGVTAAAVWGDDPERGAKIALLRAGRIKVITNCQLLTEGFDEWTVSCIGVARSTQSESMYTQMVGRGTRIPDGISNLLEARQAGIEIAKEDCILLDFVDVTSKHSLITLPTLFGLNKDLDLKGKKISEVVAEIDELKLQKPNVDVTNVTDIDKLQAYAEQVDLFKVSFAPEIIQLSEFQWHKTGHNAYVLLLRDGDHVTVLSDMLEKWHIVGKVNGNELRETHDNFEAAIQEADYKVQLLGGKMSSRIAQRTMKKDDGEPTAAQKLAAKSLGIAIPPGATFGQVRLKLNEVIARLKQKRLGKIA